MDIATLSKEELLHLKNEWSKEYLALKELKLSLDLTRGKPSPQQLDLSSELEKIAYNKFFLPDGTDTRNYGGSLDGIPQARVLAGEVFEVPAENVIVAGNSSLALMYDFIAGAYLHGLEGKNTAWINIKPKFICPVPGYDRHFRVCEDLGIEMVTVGFNAGGPDMDQIESLLRSDPSIRGMWCVPKFSNPTGHVYSDETVERIANLGKIAHKDFRVIWDNAYAVHDFNDDFVKLANIFKISEKLGTVDTVVQFGSFSKVTFSGSAIAFLGGSKKNLDFFRKRIFVKTVGPDKLRQWRHALFLGDMKGIRSHMQKHAAIVRPKFETMYNQLQNGLTGLALWTKCSGGYFISLDTKPGLASKVVDLCDEAGVKLTPAGATWPLGKDPNNSNIRLAPTYPDLASVERATQVLVASVRLATVKQALGE